MNARTLTLSAAAVAVAGAVLTGCGHSTTAGGAPATPPSPTPPPSSSAPAPAPKVTKQAITKPAGLAEQGRKITVTAQQGACQSVRLASQETSAQVTLTVEVTDNRKPGMMCAAYVKVVQVSTTLKAPLDGRKLIDGATGKEIPAPK